MEISPYNRKYNEILKPLVGTFERYTTTKTFVDNQVKMVLSDLENSIDEGILLFVDKNLIGFQIGHLYNNNADLFRKKGTFEFSMSFVLEDYRGNGFGKLMKEYFIEKLKKRLEVNEIVGCININNDISLNLHKNLDFKIIGSYISEANKYFVVKRSL